VKTMADNVSRARAQLHHAPEVRQERTADFWQRTIIEGRIQRQAGEQMAAGEKPAEKPRSPRQPRSS
jgi:hypothetical protein